MTDRIFSRLFLGTIVTIVLGVVFGFIAFYGAIAYVVVHFIHKLW